MATTTKIKPSLLKLAFCFKRTICNSDREHFKWALQAKSKILERVSKISKPRFEAQASCQVEDAEPTEAQDERAKFEHIHWFSHKI